jgi:beta-glucanase (GH16 family)
MPYKFTLTAAIMIKASVLIFCGYMLMSCSSQSVGTTTPNPQTKAFSKLVWSDEFNYNGLPDDAKWNYETGYIRNKEMQYYTSKRPENARVENGNLVITALNDSLKSGANMYPVTSASLITKGIQDWTYGRLEVRAKIPSSLGTWPAIWTLGSNISEVGWPMCGEIDILEHVGYMPDTVHFNVHTQKYNHAINTGKGTRIYRPGVQNDFHVYSVEWTKDKIDWFMDGAKVFTYANEGTGVDAWPFYQPQYLILNLAIGGAWGGQRGVDLKSLPQSMLVDYVRVYQ